MNKYILSLDKGTTSTRALLMDFSGSIVGLVQKEITQIYAICTAKNIQICILKTCNTLNPQSSHKLASQALEIFNCLQR